LADLHRRLDVKRGQNEQKDVLDSLRHNLRPRGMFTFGEVDVWMAGSGRSMDSSVLVIVGRTCGCRSALHLGVLADREIGWGQFLFFMVLRRRWGAPLAAGRMSD